jgi:cbb3-type cytochrome oxidase subunit 3
MMCDRNVINRVLQKTLNPPRFSSYSREITLALVVKFLLLGGLWWLFFAGNKQSVDEAAMANQLLGEQNSSSFYQTNQERF